MTVRRAMALILVLAVGVAALVGWSQYRQVRAAYDAYRTRIQPGVRIAGVDVGWDTPDEARQKVWERVVEPYYRDLVLRYQDQELVLSPGDELKFQIPLDGMVAEAMAASHQYDYWQGLQAWVQDEAFTLDFEVPLTMGWDEEATARFLEGVARSHDVTPLEPMIDVQALTFIPGHAGQRLDVEQAATAINDQVPHPEVRAIELPVEILEPDQSRARIASMLATLGPIMERQPQPGHYFTATVPLSTTGGLEGTPTVDYTGPLTWTFPHFAEYSGPLTQTTGFFFDPGRPGYTFNVTRATTLVELSLRGGVTTPFTFEADLVPPPPITSALLLPPLKARLAEFPGVTSMLIKNLDSGETIYQSNVDFVLSGMSLVKIGIMVEVYRFFEGKVDAQTHQELVDMLGSESCNPCANRLMAAVGGGSSVAGAGKVTGTMRRLGLNNFYICAPFQIVEGWEEEGQIIWAANTGLEQQAAQTPRYDRCVRATPHEMANLVEMVYRCAQDEGLLRQAYPNVFAPQVCQDMVDIMAANDLRNMLGSGIPSEVKLAHKHGFSGYAVPWGDTRAEVGLVYSPEATWLISFYIWQDTDWINWGINQPLYRDVSNMLYNYFNPHHPFWPLPPWAPELEEPSAVARSALRAQ